MRLRIASDELFTNRVSEIGSMLKSISPNKKLSVNPISIKGSVIFATSDIKDNSIDFKNFRFKTISQRMNASYYEIWHSIDVRNMEYYLDKAYLHLYCQDTEYLKIKEDGEFILLHSDPNIKDTEPHFQYKIGPHFHFQFAPYNLQHSHIAIELGNLDKIFISRESYNESLQRAFSLLQNQVLNLL